MRTDILAAFLLATLFFGACASSGAGAASGAPAPSSSPVVERKEGTPIVPEKRRETLADRVFLKDPESGRVSSLAELTGGSPSLMDLSASWCGPCAELTERLNTLQERFGGKVRFLMVVQKGDPPELQPGRPGYPIYILEQAPAELGIRPPEVLPTVLLFAGDGSLFGELAGLYPALFYYGVLADLTAR